LRMPLFYIVRPQRFSERELTARVAK